MIIYDVCGRGRRVYSRPGLETELDSGEYNHYTPWRNFEEIDSEDPCPLGCRLGEAD